MEMKKQGCIKNKVMERMIKANIKKVALIPPTHVLQPTFEGDEDDGIWMVWSQQHSNVVYKLQSLSLNMHLACVNGQFVGICANIKFLFS
jgi:hypothetical protein